MQHRVLSRQVGFAIPEKWPFYLWQYFWYESICIPLPCILKKNIAMRKKLTFMDVVKGLLFVAGMYLFLVFLFSIVHLVFEKNILNIENPLYAIIGGAIFLIFFGIIKTFFSFIPNSANDVKLHLKTCSFTTMRAKFYRHLTPLLIG